MVEMLYRRKLKKKKKKNRQFCKKRENLFFNIQIGLYRDAVSNRSASFQNFCFHFFQPALVSGIFLLSHQLQSRLELLIVDLASEQSIHEKSVSYQTCGCSQLSQKLSNVHIFYFFKTSFVRHFMSVFWQKIFHIFISFDQEFVFKTQYI